jgi:hypothetical protein
MRKESDIKRKKYYFILWFVWGMIMTSEAQINIPHFIFSGMHHLSEGRYVEAIKSLNVVINASPDMFEPYFYRG